VENQNQWVKVSISNF